ncbi:MAG: DUF551 domain-containing protein [Faecousia sp.]
MDEYINRVVALRKVKQLQETDPSVIGKKQFVDGFFCGLDEAETILREIPADDVAPIAHGVTVQMWIPVTESEPEKMECALCWYEYYRYGDTNRIHKAYGIGWYLGAGIWGGDVANGDKAKVLAWMPLPEPPAEG